jgi:hypothetical protein
MLLYAAIGTASGAANIRRFAIRRRFCAMAASKNASCAPLGLAGASVGSHAPQLGGDRDKYQQEHPQTT